MNLEPGRLFTPRVFAGALIVTIALLVLGYTWVVWSAPASPDATGLLAIVTNIPMPSSTPAPATSPTYDPYAPTPTPTLAPGQIGIGSIVQITGTQGEGLRIRSDPGLKGNQLFLGFDTEAYTVMDGPKDVDGYTWYYLAAINDQKRAGWAASNYITLLPQP